MAAPQGRKLCRTRSLYGPLFLWEEASSWSTYAVACVPSIILLYFRNGSLSRYISPTHSAFPPAIITTTFTLVLVPQRKAKRNKKKRRRKKEEEEEEEGRQGHKGRGMGRGDICDTGLVLRLGYDGWIPSPPADRRRRPEYPRVKLEPPLPCSALAGAPVEPSLTLSLLEGPGRARQSSPHSAVSSFSSAHPATSSATKAEKDGASEEAEAERVVSSRAGDEEEEGSERKKLRLTKEQSSLLEGMFKEHSTLNPKQKQTLAKQLNLRPRQVEVWFQNRRARTKLKQTEMDCEVLRRCCENLTDENLRLQKEVQELKALKLASPLYMKLPAATLTMCPSCERMGAAAGVAADVAKGGVAGGGPFVMAPKRHFYNPFATAEQPPAAC